MSLELPMPMAPALYQPSSMATGIPQREAYNGPLSISSAQSVPVPPPTFVPSFNPAPYQYNTGAAAPTVASSGAAPVAQPVAPMAVTAPVQKQEPAPVKVETATGTKPTPVNIGGSNFGAVGASIGGATGSIPGAIAGLAVGTAIDFILAAKAKRDAQKELNRQINAEKLRQLQADQKASALELRQGAIDAQGRAVQSEERRYQRAREKSNIISAALAGRGQRRAEMSQRINKYGR